MQSFFFSALESPSWPLLLASFTGGVASSLYPCVIGLIPVIISVVAAFGSPKLKQTFIQIALFTGCFAATMTLGSLWAATQGLAYGFWMTPTLYFLVGALLLVLGCLQVGLFPSWQSSLSAEQKLYGLTGLVALAVGTIASPCGTVYLTGLQSLAGQEDPIGLIRILSVVSIFLYAVGQSVLFWVFGSVTGLLQQKFAARGLTSVMEKLGGVLLLCLSALQFYVGFFS
ncbi:MAG: hypothetical protein KTR14_11110 [Vampirovibrio sp.]|nr:hypothetical protein [Vampirovibrio sp.]